MSTVISRKLTYEDLREFPEDGKRYELIDGEVFVSPSPTTKHQAVVGNLYFLLRSHIAGRALGRIFVAPLDVLFDEHNVVQPDVLYIGNARLSIVTPVFIHGAPDLAIEVLSPSRAVYDRERKSQLYAREGVGEVWYPDPRDDSMEVLNLTEQRLYAVSQRLSGNDAVRSAVLPDLELRLGEVFATGPLSGK